VVTKPDRLARSLPNAGAIIDDLTRREVKLSFGGVVHVPLTRSVVCCSMCWPWRPSSWPT
jgi:hypothetical protein